MYTILYLRVYILVNMYTINSFVNWINNIFLAYKCLQYN